MVGQPKEIDEEIGRDRRSDGVAQRFSGRAQDGGEDAEGPVVAHLQELPHGQRLGLAIPVDAVASQCHGDPQRGDHVFPKHQRIAGLVFHLHQHYQGVEAQADLQIADADHIPAGHPSGDEKSGDPPGIAARIERQPQHESHRDDRDAPVNPVHGLCPFRCIWLARPSELHPWGAPSPARPPAGEKAGGHSCASAGRVGEGNAYG